MHNLDSQLRDYFDRNVERITPDDVFAGRQVLVDQLGHGGPRWRSSPRLAVGLGFAMTAFILGGSLGLGIALRQPGDATGSGAPSYGFGSEAPASTGWSLLGVAAVLAVIAMVFILLALRSARSSRRNGREKVMSTTFETPPADHKLEGAHRTNRWLVAAVVVLAIALVVLGAWVVNDVASESGAEPPSEVQALIVDYVEAWNAYDGDSFLGLVSDSYEFYDDHTLARDAEATVFLIEGGEPYGFTTKTVGDYSAEVSRDGTEYVVSAPSMIGTDGAPDSARGISVYRVQNSPDRGWIVTYHAYVGELPG